MGHVYLIVAIIAEILATLSLKSTTVEGPQRWVSWTVVVVGYMIAYVMLHLCLRTGFPLGVAYAIWCGAGITVVAVAGVALFRESMTPVQIVGIVFVIVGIAALQLGADDAVPDNPARVTPRHTS